MRTIESEFVSGLRHHFYYPCDLEKMSTMELVWVLRGLRKTISRETYGYQQEWVDKYMKNVEGKWIEFSWDEWNCYHTMVWMVKKVLGERPHVAKSKGERRKMRQLRAKYHLKSGDTYSNLIINTK